MLVGSGDFEKAVKAAVATPVGSRSSAANDGVLLAYLRGFLDLYSS